MRSGSILWGAIAAALAAGAAIAVIEFGRPAASVAPPPKSSAAPPGAGGTLGDYAAAWSRAPLQPAPAAGADGDRAATMQATRHLREQAQSDPATLAALILRYEHASDTRERASLGMLLSSIDQPAVIDLAKRLVASPDAQKRRDGLALIAKLAPGSADARAAVRQALASEQSPAGLVDALRALTPHAAGPAEIRGTVAQLERLARHPDPAVRRQSIFQLAQWDKTGASAEQLTQALSDPFADVRRAAILALGRSAAHPAGAKAALSAIVYDPNESRQTRSLALQALQAYAVTPEDAQALARVRPELGGY